MKIAGAPISWGVCEVPNWGHQMSPERVLKEMADLGLGATEFGPEGFLPIDPAARAKVLRDHGMEAVGGFFPVIMHRADVDPLPKVQQELEAYVASGAKTLVLSADTGLEGYDTKREALDEAGWQLFNQNLDRIKDYAASLGITAVLHPHVGTMVETEDDINHVLAGSSIKFCLDTGHMLIGGTDPVAFARNHADRVAHSHLKDVNLEVAKRVQSGEITYYQGILQGMYVPLGEGDVDVRSIVTDLVKSGYDGWFALEQDNVINSEPGLGEGPLADAKKSVDFIRSVVSSL
ncbi:sugar phosphate isomerase/epimerase family protein [Candidatus Rhodoluna planktonica]|uniref:sugar phosphate isomerase/epimerase family protein n=1 Tax=Candidatus Rhodoluna planktonica TaxID=535712 RepID=UPI001F250DEB|nr:sugar phosphate isomerase/epimerase [Candidatus Rhodoluna planktonica]